MDEYERFIAIGSFIAIIFLAYLGLRALMPREKYETLHQTP